MSIYSKSNLVKLSLVSLSMTAVLSVATHAQAQTTLNAGDVSFAGNDVCVPNLVELPLSLQKMDRADPATLPTVIEGDQIEITQQGQRTLKGNVSVEQGRRGLYADNVVYDEANYRAQAQGNVTLYSENANLLQGDRIDFEVDTFIGTAVGAKFELAKLFKPDDNREHNRFEEDYSFFAPWANAYDAETIARMEAEKEALEEAQEQAQEQEQQVEPQYEVSGRGAAKRIDFEGLDFMILREAQFTTCPRGKDDVVISASELQLDQVEGIGRAKDATLRFLDVPIFYFPSVTFPINDQRKTGFLFPGIGYDSRSGIFTEVPYYWNIAPEQDATFVARYLTERGAQVGAEYRFLTENDGRGILRGEFLPSDSYAGEDNEINEFEGEDRYAFGFDYDQRFSNKWQIDVDLQTVSDYNYLRDFDNNLDIVASSFVPQTAKLKYFGSDYRFLGEVKSYDVVKDNIRESSKPYEKLPGIEFEIRPQEIGFFEIGLDSEYDDFVHDSGARDSGSRLRIKPYLELPIEEIYGYFKPKLSLQTVRYSVEAGTGETNQTSANNNSNNNTSTKSSFTNVGNNAPDSVSVPIFSIDSGLNFERIIKRDSGNLLQTLEPRVFFLNVPEELEQEEFALFDTSETTINSYSQLFRENRFTGGDRVGDTQQITLGLSSRLIDDEEGQEKYRFSIGQALYLRDREVGLRPDSKAETSSVSDLVAEVTATLNEDWRLTGFTRWDEEEGKLGAFRVSANYSHSPRRKARVSYIENLDSNQQLNLSLSSPIASHWQLDSSVNYSIEDAEIRSSELALSYDSCCWAIKAGLQRYLVDDGEYANRILFTLELDQLGSISNRSRQF